MGRNSELLVPTGLVHERLGITDAPKKLRLGGSKHVIRRLNIKDADSPARGVWIDRDATIKFLEAEVEATGGNLLFERAVKKLTMVTAGSG